MAVATKAERDAALNIAAAHEHEAGSLPADSEMRALALRCAARWRRMAGAPGHLALATNHEGADR